MAKANHFQQLPQELIEKICTFLIHKDIKALRETCRKCSRSGRSILFERIFISSHLKDLVSFVAVTQSESGLRDYVKEIMWDDTTYRELLLDHQRFRENYNNSPDCALSLSERSSNVGAFQRTFEERERILSAWTTLAYASKRIRTSYADQSAFRQALPRLPNLQSLTLTNWDFTEKRSKAIGTSPAHREWNELRLPQAFAPAVNWEYNYPLVGAGIVDQLNDILDRGFYSERGDYTPFGYSNVRPGVRRPFRGFVIVLSELYLHPVMLRSFGIRAKPEEYPEGGLCPWILTRPSNSLLAWEDLASRLTKLHINLSGLDPLPPAAQQSACDGLRRIIHGATNVQHLFLKLPMTKVHLVLAITDCPQLRTLALLYTKIDIDYFRHFLLRHRETLTQVRLAVCDLVSTLPNADRPNNWQTLAAMMRVNQLRYDHCEAVVWNQVRGITPVPRFEPVLNISSAATIAAYLEGRSEQYVDSSGRFDQIHEEYDKTGRAMATSLM